MPNRFQRSRAVNPVRKAGVFAVCSRILIAFLSVGQALAGTTPTTTLLASSANPSVFGAQVTLTATVTANPAATGKVTFYDGANILGVGTLNGSGVAVLNTIMIQAGHRNLRATYAGDATYAASTSAALPQVVNAIAGNSFTFRGSFPVHYASTGNLAAGDFNRDGALDIAYPSYGTKDVSILIGDGIGSFAAAVNYAVSGNPQWIAAADFDGDGKLDLFCTVVAPPSGHTAQILFGNGDGTFQPAVDVPNLTATFYSQIAVGDFDGNGAADVALEIGTGALILLGHGDGTFTNGTTVAAGGSAVTVGDFRGTGRADLATGGTIATMFLNNGGGTGTFTAVTAASALNPINNAVNATYVADLHGNGHEDVITGAGTYDLHVVASNGDGTFQAPVFFGASGGATSYAAGDFNGDGSLDLLTNGSVPAGGLINAATVLYNNGNGTLKSSIPIYGGCLGTTAIFVADFNHDGIADFATADQFGGVCVWLGSANPVLATTTTSSFDVTVPYQVPSAAFPMTANVSSPGATVNSGTVNFVVPYFLHTGTPSQFSASAAVSNGAATVQLQPFDVLDVGTYNAYVTYSGTATFAPSGAQTVHVIVTGIPTTTVASAASASFNASSQSVTLTAAVTSTATVNTGTVTFFVLGIGSVSGSVVNGAASASLAIPAGQTAGSYSINAVYNAVSPLGNSSDNTKSLVISKVGSTTTAGAASATFSALPQNVTLNATVTSPSGAVNGGTVSFTVTGVGAATSGNVSNGAASATLTIPAGQAASSYTIQATYSGTSNLNGSSDNTKSLVISGAPTTTTLAVAATATFRASVQPVTLSATVTSASGIVNGGTFTFTVTGVGTVTSSSVVNGAASALLSIPAGQGVGSYAINAVYSGNGTLPGSSDNTKLLTISQASTTTAASAASATFSVQQQTVTLSATVTSPSGAVNSGTVSFTVTGVGSATSGTVTNGAASATLPIPAGTAASSYTIQAAYSGTGNLNSSSDNTRSLVISAAATTTTTASAAAATFRTAAQPVTLSATVTSTSGIVNGGTFTFGVTGIGSVTSGIVVNGAASATLTIPAGQGAGSYAINAVYSGNGTLPGSSDNTRSLVISKANTTTTASAATANFSSFVQTVTLNATVTSPSGLVNSGTVSFTVTGIGTVSGGTAGGGNFSAVLTIPAGQAAATYGIQGAYSGGVNLNGSSDNTKSLVISSAGNPTTTTPNGPSATYSASAQTVNLTATVTSTGGRVNGGTVTFTVPGVGTATGTVVGGNVSASLTIPGGTRVGSYVFNTVYNPAAGFLGSSAINNFLQINQAIPVVTWANPAPVPQGTLLGPAQLNATANTPGVFFYYPPAGTVVRTSPYRLSVIFRPTDTVDYSIAEDSVTLMVGPPLILIDRITSTRVDPNTQEVLVSVTIRNVGSSTTTNVQLIPDIWPGGDGPPPLNLPLNLGTLAPGATATAVLRFSPGSNRGITPLSGTYTGGTFEGFAFWINWASVFISG